jgi:hypothetical protein
MFRQAAIFLAPKRAVKTMCSATKKSNKTGTNVKTPKAPSRTAVRQKARTETVPKPKARRTSGPSKTASGTKPTKTADGSKSCKVAAVKVVAKAPAKTAQGIEITAPIHAGIVPRAQRSNVAPPLPHAKLSRPSLVGAAPVSPTPASPVTRVTQSVEGCEAFSCVVDWMMSREHDSPRCGPPSADVVSAAFDGQLRAFLDHCLRVACVLEPIAPLPALASDFVRLAWTSPTATVTEAAPSVLPLSSARGLLPPNQSRRSNDLFFL